MPRLDNLAYYEAEGMVYGLTYVDTKTMEGYSYSFSDDTYFGPTGDSFDIPAGDNYARFTVAGNEMAIDYIEVTSGLYGDIRKSPRPILGKEWMSNEYSEETFTLEQTERAIGLGIHVSRDGREFNIFDNDDIEVKDAVNNIVGLTIYFIDMEDFPEEQVAHLKWDYTAEDQEDSEV